ncbi:hypothetical protein B841_03630 [Corynebacterium maris DSM 45190]|uniref:Beta-N-acetylhexosaminidase n=1 Tax=Corynebacterium maris DSM 45190 TaxID=1224163 RepID=S5SSS9_9CORY|nr:hypothetical protein [Corynebacterium maris]AGS34209.1 hypothetical protein B841_03630 [Corynebacterium maris DSM 45190]
MPHNRLTRTAVFAAAVALTAGLSACTDGGEVEETTAPETTAAQTSTSPDAAPTTSATPSTTPTTETETETESESPTSSPRGTHSTGGEDGLSENVAEAAERFGSLAPASLFEQFDDCTPTGLEGSYECSGPEVGQVQFFDSQSKAASTTQLLTELRSSRVVEDTGRHVVGWSTLGTTAVITVVDNELGLVMQQLVSSDIVEPEERIKELGLIEETEETTTSPSRDDASDAEFSNADERREA